jgi:hypothetical protein
VQEAMNIINFADDDEDDIGNFFSLSEVDVNYRSKVLPKVLSTRGVGISAPPPDIIVKTKNLGQSLISLKKLLTQNTENQIIQNPNEQLKAKSALNILPKYAENSLSSDYYSNPIFNDIDLTLDFGRNPS